MIPLIEPIIPTLSTRVPIGREWLYEPKLDGFRGTLYIENRNAFFRSKTTKEMTRFAALAAELAAKLDVRDAVLDGEIVVMGADGPDFRALFARRGTPRYFAFDLLWLNGRDLRGLTLTRRKLRLKRVIVGTSIGFVDAHSDPNLFDAAVQMDLEGIVAKRRNDPYVPETSWVKVKHAGYSQVEGRGELFRRRR
jgi:bifunctional non-homologous end joining protein LigD